ncbi:MAG: alpha/beta hydrolase [Steroidobacteraceae bacterium]
MDTPRPRFDSRRSKRRSRNGGESRPAARRADGAGRHAEQTIAGIALPDFLRGPAADTAKNQRGLTWLDAVKDTSRAMLDIARSPWSALALARLPRGDGHSVLVLPGFLTTDNSTMPLRWFLQRLGYRVHGWELGVNFGFSTAYSYDIEVLIEHRLKEVFIESGDRKISLIGWSLGGVYAKALARRYPQLIREVITLGAPLRGDAGDGSVWRLYEWVSDMDLHAPEIAQKLRELSAPLPAVPITAFYSRNDGVVPWRNSCETPGRLVQNIEISCSHLGMGFDTYVLYLIAHRLAQKDKGGWMPLDASALRRRFERERRVFYRKDR